MKTSMLCYAFVCVFCSSINSMNTISKLNLQKSTGGDRLCFIERALHTNDLISILISFMCYIKNEFCCLVYMRVSSVNYVNKEEEVKRRRGTTSC